MSIRLLAFAAIIVLAKCASAADGDAAPGRALQSYTQKLPLYESDDVDEYPQEKEYVLERLLPAAGVGIVLSILSLLCLVTCICCRGCALIESCTCCRGNLCDKLCATGMPDPDGYAFKTRCRAYFLLLFLVLALVASGGVGVYGVMKTTDGTKDLFDVAVASANTITGVNAIATASMTKLGDSVDVASRTKEITDVTNKVYDLKDNFDKYVDVVDPVAYAYFSLFVALPFLLGTLAYCCKMSWPTSCLGCMALTLLLLIWVLFGIFYTTGTFMDDTCVQFQLWYSCNEDKNFDQSYCVPGQLKIDDWLKCPDKADFQSGYFTTYDQATTYIANYTATYPGGVQFTLPTKACSTPQSPYCVQRTSSGEYDNNRDWRKGTCQPCSGSGHDMWKQSKVCHERAILLAADAMYSNSYIISCSYISQLARDVTKDDGSCNKLGDGFIYIFGSHGAIGVLYFCVVFIAISSWKWWSADNYREYKMTSDYYLSENAHQHERYEAHAQPTGVAPYLMTAEQYRDNNQFPSHHGPSGRNCCGVPEGLEMKPAAS